MSKVFESLNPIEQARVEGAKTFLGLPNLNEILSPAEYIAFAWLCCPSRNRTGEMIPKWCAAVGVSEGEVHEHITDWGCSPLRKTLECNVLHGLVPRKKAPAAPIGAMAKALELDLGV